MEKKKLVSKKAQIAALQAPAKNITAVSPEAEEKALRQVRQMDTRKKVQRITIDMPLYLYDLIKDETEKKGYTITGFMVSLTRQYFEGE